MFALPHPLKKKPKKNQTKIKSDKKRKRKSVVLH
jgi:hypothetical protein